MPSQLAQDGPQAPMLLSASQLNPQAWKPERQEHTLRRVSQEPGWGQSALLAQPGLHSLPVVQKKPDGQPPAQFAGSSVHAPALQNWFELHRVPQLPQLRPSVRVSTQEPAQATLPFAHTRGPVLPPPLPPVPPPVVPPPPPVEPARHRPRLHDCPGKHWVHS